MTTNIGILIIEKTGTVKTLCVKQFNESELFKRCGFKSETNFCNHGELRVKTGDLTYIVTVYGKDTGRANFENKYDFPPPLDNTLFFGSCALVLHTEYKGETGPPILESIDMALWEQLHEKLFGGFEDLSSGAMMAADEMEEDEVDAHKTKVGGYLKDGFVVDDSDTLSVATTVDLDLDEEEEYSEESDESELMEETYFVE